MFKVGGTVVQGWHPQKTGIRQPIQRSRQNDEDHLIWCPLQWHLSSQSPAVNSAFSSVFLHFCPCRRTTQAKADVSVSWRHKNFNKRILLSLSTLQKCNWKLQSAWSTSESHLAHHFYPFVLFLGWVVVGILLGFSLPLLTAALCRKNLQSYHGISLFLSCKVVKRPETSAAKGEWLWELQIHSPSNLKRQRTTREMQLHHYNVTDRPRAGSAQGDMMRGNSITRWEATSWPYLCCRLNQGSTYTVAVALMWSCFFPFLAMITSSILLKIQWLLVAKFFFSFHWCCFAGFQKT